MTTIEKIIAEFEKVHNNRESVGDCLCFLGIKCKKCQHLELLKSFLRASLHSIREETVREAIEVVKNITGASLADSYSESDDIIDKIETLSALKELLVKE